MAMDEIFFEAIKLVNFKGVENLHFSFADADAIILGGKNGYGKTTIYDALELVLTGSIKRYRDYKEEYTNKKLSYGKSDKPLVCHMELPYVEVSLYLVIKAEEKTIRMILTRRAKTDDMENPIDFKVFGKLYYRFQEDGKMKEADISVLKACGLDYLRENYQMINYVGQEECTRFLKSKDSSRVEVVRELFNTTYFDRRIEKIDTYAVPRIDSMLTNFNNEKKKVEDIISAIQKYEVSTTDNDIRYNRLFKDGTIFNWDSEFPSLSNEDYDSVLSADGILDRLQLFLEKEDDFRRYRKSLFVNRILESTSQYAIFLQYAEKRSIISLFNKYQQKTVLPFERLNIENLQSYSFEFDDQLTDVITNERIDSIQTKLELCKKLNRGANSAEKAYNMLLEERNVLAKHIQEHARQLSIQTCPICGQSFENSERLLSSINDTLQLQFSTVSVFADEVAKEYQKMKDSIADALSIINRWFEDKGVTVAVSKAFSELNVYDIEKNIDILRKHGMDVSTYIGKTVEQTELLLIMALKEWLEPFEVSLDYTELNEIRDSYVRYLREESKNKKSIEQKRVYLTILWSKQRSKQLVELSKQKTEVEHSISQCAAILEQVKKIKKQIIAQRNQYLKKVTGEMEVLFYIYSGRIMQDSFYGRGLYMKHEPGKYVRFVTNFRSDVDALYNMSSGQLVALILAFTLSLNKLYSKTKFIAIDDPVQTIDDINVWGFVETLRHEFQNYQILLSTHELNHGAFLRYKLNNFGMKAEYRDMMQERIREEQNR